MSKTMKGEKPALVPRLRFPEFQEVGEWVKLLLDDVCDMQSGKFIAAAEISSNFEECMFPCFGGNGLRGYTKNYNKSGRYLLIGRQGALCGNVNLVDGDFYATEHAVVTTPKSGISTDWLFYNLTLLNLNRFATGQAQPGLSVEVLDKVPCAVPRDEKEQQKIADCLSSLDALIAAQADKVGALKTHKKGMMQQLFPREGETVPRLRFPEFRDAGEWKRLTLGEIVGFLSGGTPSKERADYWDGDIPWVSAASMHEISIERSDRNITQNAVDDGARIVPTGTLLILVRGSMLHKRVPIGIAACKVAFNQDVKALRMKADVFEKFMLHLLISNESSLLKAVSGTGIGAGKLDTNELEEFPICVPEMKKEQQKIADCLSYLDALIAAYSEKLDVLNAHKKGLMQQLFPATDQGVVEGG